MKLEVDLHKYKKITDDSREVIPSSIFVAIKGFASDGHDYIKAAIDNGATLVIADSRYYKKNSNTIPNKVELLLVEDSKSAFGILASKIYKLPKNIVGVTGTNGKTSTTYFYKQIIELLGQNSASIGTLGVISSKNAAFFKKIDTITTPGISQMYYILSQLAENGVDNVAIEVSSHGLDQKRLDGIKFNAGAFTSFSQDHLDYHETMDKYLEAKLRFFSDVLPKNSPVVINSDMDVSDKVISVCKAKGHRVFTYGFNGKYIKILSINYLNHATEVDVLMEDKKITIHLPIIGEFQVNNILCAMSLAIQSGFKKEDCLKALEKLKPVPGRMELVKENIIVDYAHTHDALEKVIHSIRAVMSSGRLIVLFGCGGDRDKKKRKLMGEVVDQLADLAIITDDNPRTEDPESIRAEIKKYCHKGIVVGGRREAIQKAIELKEKEDFLLIAGKGHENYQIIGKEKFDFDDVEISKELLNLIRK